MNPDLNINKCTFIDMIICGTSKHKTSILNKLFKSLFFTGRRIVNEFFEY